MRDKSYWGNQYLPQKEQQILIVRAAIKQLYRTYYKVQKRNTYFLSKFQAQKGNRKAALCG